eukprot:1115597-Amphidinium_carterae.1
MRPFDLAWAVVGDEQIKGADVVFDTLPGRGTLNALQDWWISVYKAEIHMRTGMKLQSVPHSKCTAADLTSWEKFESMRSRVGLTLISRSEKLEKARACAIYGADQINYV